jgi:hypothetical protein
MKKIRINWVPSKSPVNSIYEGTGTKFSWLAPGKNASELLQVTGWHSCRETFTGEICKFVSKANPSPWVNTRGLDLKKTRVAIVHKHRKSDFFTNTEIDLKWVKCAVRLLNIFEKSQGWSLTRASMCEDLDVHNSCSNVFCFNSSPRWMQASQLLSLYLLIIRLGRYYTEFAKFKKVTDLEDVYKIFSKDAELKKQTDPSNFLETWKYWMLMLNNHADLFFSKTLEENYKPNTGAYGIKYMISGIADANTMKVWRELIKK